MPKTRVPHLQDHCVWCVRVTHTTHPHTLDRQHSCKLSLTDVGFQSHTYRPEFTDQIKEVAAIVVHPTKVTCQIKEAATIEALLCTHRTHKNNLNHIHVSACWTSFGQVATQRLAERYWLQRKVKELELLVQHTVRRAEAGEIDARQVANVAYGATRSGKCLSVGVLFEPLARAAEWQMCEFKLQQLANTAWAFATVSLSDEKLLTALARVALRRMSKFNAQDLANTAWAFTTMNLSDERLFSAFARSVERQVNELNAQNLANTAWAFATVNLSDEKLFKAVAKAVERRVSELNEQELANMAWAVATMNLSDKKLFTTFARAALLRVSAFNAQNLANTAWAFTTMILSDEMLFTALA